MPLSTCTWGVDSRRSANAAKPLHAHSMFDSVHGLNSLGIAVGLLMWSCIAQASSGNGGGISSSVAGDRAVSAASTTFANNSAISGGAVYVSGPTNGVAVGRFDCDRCTLKDNRAVSKVGGQAVQMACKAAC